MVDFFSLLGIAIGAFVASNIDDIFVLMIFFSSHRFQVRDVVLGQYLGIGILTAISAVGSLLAFVVPLYIIGLLGLVPIGIGIIRLVQLRSNKEISERTIVSNRSSSVSMLTVAAVTFSNGGDNIWVYTPLFPKYNCVQGRWIHLERPLNKDWVYSTIVKLSTLCCCSSSRDCCSLITELSCCVSFIFG